MLRSLVFRTIISLATVFFIIGMIGCNDNSQPFAVDNSSAKDADRFTSIQAEFATKTEPPASSSESLWTRKAGENWPRFLGSTYDGVSRETGIRTDWSDGKLRTVWSMAVGTSYGIGAVAEGRYFQHERIGDSERLHAVGAETGEELWVRDLPVEYTDMYGYNNGPRDTPAIDDGDVFTFGVAGQLSCTDAISGKLKWTVDSNTKYGVIQNFFGVGSSALVLGDAVIVMVGGSPKEDASIAPGRLDRVSANNSAVVAFDRRTGKEIWMTGNDLASYSSPRPMKIGDTTIVILLARGGLIAVDPASGKTLWQYHHRADTLESVNGMMPVVIGNKVFLSDCYGSGSVLLEATLEKCKVVWQDPDNRREQSFRAHWATPIAIGDFIYGCSGRNEPDSDLRCINWKTGKLAWSDRRQSRTGVLFVDNHFIVLDETGEMQLIRVDATKLSVVTSINLHESVDDRIALGQPYWAAPILSHGLLYVRGSERMVCLELIENGSQDPR